MSATFWRESSAAKSEVENTTLIINAMHVLCIQPLNEIRSRISHEIDLRVTAVNLVNKDIRKFILGFFVKAVISDFDWYS